MDRLKLGSTKKEHKSKLETVPMGPYFSSLCLLFFPLRV